MALIQWTCWQCTRVSWTGWVGQVRTHAGCRFFTLGHECHNSCVGSWFYWLRASVSFLGLGFGSECHRRIAGSLRGEHCLGWTCVGLWGAGSGGALIAPALRTHFWPGGSIVAGSPESEGITVAEKKCCSPRCACCLKMFISATACCWRAGVLPLCTTDLSTDPMAVIPLVLAVRMSALLPVGPFAWSAFGSLSPNRYRHPPMPSAHPQLYLGRNISRSY